MAYIDAYIEKCPSFGWEGGPTFKTLIVTMASGRERRNASWSKAQHTYSLPFRNIKQADYVGIKQMHLVARGQLHAFKFRDHLDNSATNAQFAVGDGVQTVFQLGKLSVLDGVSYERDAFVIESAVVKAGGVVTSVTLDADRGLVTFAGAPGLGVVLTWTGVFSMWVRFGHDDLPFSIDNKSPTGSYYISGSVSLLEMPPPPL